MESFLKNEHAVGAAFEPALKSALDAWTIGHMSLQKDGAKEIPERATVTKYRQEQLATMGVEAAVLERNGTAAIRYRALSDEEVRALVKD